MMERNEMLEVFCTNMSKELINRVNGFIFVRVLEDSDDVQVSIEYRGFKFKYIFENTEEYLRYGGSASAATKMILDKYRSFIMNRYFLKQRTPWNKPQRYEGHYNTETEPVNVETFTGEEIPEVEE